MLTFQGRDIEKIAVIGSGQIGPDIALYFAKVLSPFAVKVVVLDVSPDALARGKAKTFKKIDKGVESGAFRAESGSAMKNSLEFTSRDGDVFGATWVVEAATETKSVKRQIFRSMESLTSRNTILTSNSSHMEPETIFAEMSHPGRCLVTHYFFPAERNPIVEVVPGAETADDVTEWVMAFYEWMGKVPIRVGSRYGYAIDPIFEGLFLAAALCVEGGYGTTREVDVVARETLGLGVGPFTAMNLTGGNPITLHGLTEMHDKIMPYFRAPAILEDAVQTSQPWDVPARGERITVDAKSRNRIAGAMKAAYFGLACEILDSGITNIADLEMAIELALVIKPPFRMMNRTGVAETLSLVKAYAAEHQGFKVASVLEEQAGRDAPWRIPVVMRRDIDGVAVLTIRRPKVLNALNRDAFVEIGEQLEAIRDDKAIRAVVITGYGKKAFVSGADVGFLARIESPEIGERTSRESQLAIGAIAAFPKPVVAAINGVAFGGGCELAIGCHARVAASGLAVLAAQPEVNLGIIPGAGGTQRLPRLIGLARAAELLRTGRAVSSDEALQIGLVDELAEDVVDRAVALAASLAGDGVPRHIAEDPIRKSEPVPDVDIGHRSRAVDALLVRAIQDGAALSLDEGLELEARLFGEVCATEDMRIGVTNFLENGPRAKAPFVHR